MSRPKRIKRLRKEDDDIQKFVIWCKEVGIRISKQVSTVSCAVADETSLILVAAGIAHQAWLTC